jgi:hypothetical protein
MGKLFAGVVVFAAGTAIAVAAPAWATPTDAPSQQQVYLQETQQVTGRAHLIFKGDDGAAAVEGKADLIEYSQGLVVYEPSAAPVPGQPADLKVRPASPVHTTTTATVSWTAARTLPTPRSF